MDTDTTKDAQAAEPGAEQLPQPGTITEPAKLLRIASMVRELLDETRQTSIDEAGRKRLAVIYHRAVGELSEVLSDDLKEELDELAPPLEGVPTESEIRVAGPARRLARGPVPRHPGGDVGAAAGCPSPVRGAPPPRSPRRPASWRAPADRHPRPVPLGGSVRSGRAGGGHLIRGR